MSSHAVFRQGANVHMLYTLIGGGGGGQMSRLISIQFSTLIFDDLKRLNNTLKRHKNVP